MNGSGDFSYQREGEKGTFVVHGQEKGRAGKALCTNVSCKKGITPSQGVRNCPGIPHTITAGWYFYYHIRNHLSRAFAA